jgi:hypothetical protein
MLDQERLLTKNRMLSELFKQPWPPGYFWPQCPCCANDDGTNDDSPWCTPGKLFLQSGQFTSTIKTSQVAINPAGISWDGTNTPWANLSDLLVLTSGQFTSTIKTTQDISVTTPQLHDISWDGTNTPWCEGGGLSNKLHVQSGQFSSTIKTSLDPIIDSNFHGISWDGTNTPCSGGGNDKLYLISGQFTSTVKDSLSVGALTTNPAGISWDGTNTPWCSNEDDLFVTSGQFTSTLKTSQAVGGGSIPVGINTNKRVTG